MKSLLFVASVTTVSLSIFGQFTSVKAASVRGSFDVIGPTSGNVNSTAKFNLDKDPFTEGTLTFMGGFLGTVGGGTFAIANPIIDVEDWSVDSFDFLLADGTIGGTADFVNSELRLPGIGGGAATQIIGNVQSTSSIPEPSTVLGLLTITGLGLGLKQKKQS